MFFPATAKQGEFSHSCSCLSLAKSCIRVVWTSEDMGKMARVFVMFLRCMMLEAKTHKSCGRGTCRFTASPSCSPRKLTWTKNVPTYATYLNIYLGKKVLHNPTFRMRWSHSFAPDRHFDMSNLTMRWFMVNFYRHFQIFKMLLLANKSFLGEIFTQVITVNAMGDTCIHLIFLIWVSFYICLLYK